MKLIRSLEVRVLADVEDEGGAAERLAEGIQKEIYAALQEIASDYTGVRIIANEV